jgi:hypothetical protein
MTHKFCPLTGEHWEQPRWRPRVGRPPDRLRHATLHLEWRRERRGGHSPRPGGPVGRHLAETKRPPPKRYDSSSMILPEYFRQGDSGSSEMPQHRLVILQDLLLLRLLGAVRPVPP